MKEMAQQELQDGVLAWYVANMHMIQNLSVVDTILAWEEYRAGNDELQRVRQNHLNYVASLPPLCCGGHVVHEATCATLRGVVKASVTPPDVLVDALQDKVHIDGPSRPAFAVKTNGVETDGECVCKGNWRALVKEYEPLIGTRFKDKQGQIYRFFGLVLTDEDYYYGMTGKSGMRLLSCVGSLDGGHGLTAIDGPRPEGTTSTDAYTTGDNDETR